MSSPNYFAPSTSNHSLTKGAIDSSNQSSKFLGRAHLVGEGGIRQPNFAEGVSPLTPSLLLTLDSADQKYKNKLSNGSENDENKGTSGSYG